MPEFAAKESGSFNPRREGAMFIRPKIDRLEFFQSTEGWRQEQFLLLTMFSAARHEMRAIGSRFLLALAMLVFPGRSVADELPELVSVYSLIATPTTFSGMVVRVRCCWLTSEEQSLNCPQSTAFSPRDYIESFH